MNTRNYFEKIGMWPQGTHIIRAYVIGFILSLILTFAAYYLAVHQLFSMRTAIIALMVLALVQFVVQIVCFLHLGKGTASRERLVVLCCAIVVVLIVVTGSVWIMFSLNARQMPSEQQMENYMNSQAGI